MSFQLIPVIDLQSGLVVHARRGERSKYLPIQSSLCKGSDAVEVVTALLALHDFGCLYIADLDAILRRGNNLAAIRAIRNRFQDLVLWIDSGIADRQSLLTWQELGLGTAVIGSEVLDSAESLSDLLAAGFDPVLSLDFRGSGFVGPHCLQENSRLWPAKVIAMTLAQVGSGLGPDLNCLNSVIMQSNGRSVFAAGGIRSREDIEAVIRCGADGALLATALHEGRLKQDDLACFAGSGCPKVQCPA